MYIILYNILVHHSMDKANVISKAINYNENNKNNMNNTNNMFIMNNGFVDVHWGIFRKHCVPMRKVIDKAKVSSNLTSHLIFDIYIEALNPYHIKRICNGLCGLCKGKHSHQKDKDTGIKVWEWQDILMPPEVI